MSERMMILPSKDVSQLRLVRVPEDLSPHEAYRHVTALIGEIPAEKERRLAPLDALEDHGFEPVPFLLGPSLD